MQFLFFGGEEYRCAVSPCLWMIAKRLIRNRGYCQHNFKVFVVAKKTNKENQKKFESKSIHQRKSVLKPYFG